MRARSIKPGICDNELLGTADPFCTLLFERLWMMADREGRLEDRPLRIKAQAFPYREGLDIQPLLAWLTENGFIRRYTVDGARYIQVAKFTEHQSPHVKEAPSKIPAPDSPGASTSPAPDSTPPKPALAALTPDSGLLTPDSGSLRSPSVEQSRSTAPAVQEVFDHWQQTHATTRAVLDTKRRRRIVDGLKHFTADQLRDSISGYLNSPHHMGTDPKGNGVKYNDIELFLRDTSHIETGLRLLAHPPRPPPKETAMDRFRRLNSEPNDRVIEHEPEQQRAITSN